MKSLFLVMSFLFTVSTGVAQTQPVKIKTTDYTCNQLNGIVQEYRSVWIKGFLGAYDNLAATRSEIQRCSGGYSSADRIRCNYWVPSLRTKDTSKCKVGVRCSCVRESDDHGNR